MKFSLPGVLLAALPFTGRARAREVDLPTVSRDSTREFHELVNRAFVAQWTLRTGGDMRVLDSHGGSRKQARAVIGDLETVVTLALAGDIHAIAELARFPMIKQVTIATAFGGWKRAQSQHSADGGLFDRIHQAGR
ncbi:MAG: sulfate transporter, sulfate-binding protein [Ramlibacter sp.]|nr:sulfate transporter, sulfate-binding protein [Ramlibacter sp.]